MSNIAYLRISHIESLNGTSLEVQESRCRAFAELHGFTIDKVYSEVTSGATEFRKRPVFQKVLTEMKHGSKLVVSRLDRLSRKVIDTLKLIDDFKKERKEICITDIGNVHTDGISKVFVTILASLAEIERENVSTRIKASKISHLINLRRNRSETSFNNSNNNWINKLTTISCSMSKSNLSASS